MKNKSKKTTHQSKKWSAFEVTLGLVIGLTTSIFIFQPLIFGFYGLDFGHTTNTIIAVWFTVISFFRSYMLRRFFVWFHRVVEEDGHFISNQIKKYHQYKENKKMREGCNE